MNYNFVQRAVLMDLKRKGLGIVDFVLIDAKVFDGMMECFVKLYFNGHTAYMKSFIIDSEEDFSDSLEFDINSFFSEYKSVYEGNRDLSSFIEEQLVNRQYFLTEGDFYLNDDFQDFVEKISLNYSTCDSFLLDIENIDLTQFIKLMHYGI